MNDPVLETLPCDEQPDASCEDAGGDVAIAPAQARPLLVEPSGPAPASSRKRPLVVWCLLGAVVGVAWFFAVRSLAFRRVEKPLPLSSFSWLSSAAASASLQAESAIQEAALRDDPGPIAAGWPVAGEAAWIGDYRGRLVTRFDTQEKVVALTFDDGPDGTTREYVEVLESHGAKATFFFRGSDMPVDEIEYAAARGMEIGNHTGSHVGLSEQSLETMTREMDHIDEQVYLSVGRKPLWVRARAGSVSPRALRAIEERGQLYANWNVNANDTNWGITSASIAGNVCRSVTPGSIVLLHQTRPDTLLALPQILSELKARGYRFLTLSEMAAISDPDGASPTAATASVP